MTVLHVQRQGAALHLDGDVLRVMCGNVAVAVAQVPLLERVYLHGAVQMSARVMARLLDDGIDCVLLTAAGGYRGRLEGARSGAGVLRALQARAAAEPQLRLRAARAIVLHKIAAQQRALRVLLRAREDAPELTRAARAAVAAADIDEVRG